MTAKTLDDHIEVLPGDSGGQPRIAGRDIAVREIVVLHERLGKEAAQIAAEKSLTLADVHAALAYYHDHQDEMDASVAQLAREPAYGSSSSAQTLMDRFLQGVGSVLEFFPSSERFDQWRLSRDTSLEEWPGKVRRQLNELREDAPTNNHSA